MCGEAAGERHVPPDPRFVHPASRSDIPANLQLQPTNFLSVLCSYSRNLGAICYPTKCKGIFSFDFGHSAFIGEFRYLKWMELSAQRKHIDVTDFSTKAKPPTLPKLYNIYFHTWRVLIHKMWRGHPCFLVVQLTSTETQKKISKKCCHD